MVVAAFHVADWLEERVSPDPEELEARFGNIRASICDTAENDSSQTAGRLMDSSVDGNPGPGVSRKSARHTLPKGPGFSPDLCDTIEPVILVRRV